jgi:hypothetical protein
MSQVKEVEGVDLKPIYEKFVEQLKTKRPISVKGAVLLFYGVEEHKQSIDYAVEYFVSGHMPLEVYNKIVEIISDIEG